MPRRLASLSQAKPRPPRQPTHEAATATEVWRRSDQRAESWTEAQQNLALALHVTGRKTLNEIAERLSLRTDTVAKMIVAAKRAWGRQGGEE
jgi:hypothetical protein